MTYTKFILDIVLDKKLRQKDFNKLDFDKLLLCSSFNRILYIFSKNLLKSQIKLSKEEKRKVDLILDMGKKKIDAFKKSVDFLEKVSKDIKVPFLYVKTYKFIDYITFDVDFLIPFKDFEKTIYGLKKHGAIIKPHPGKQGKHQRNCFRQGLIKMDLHRKFFWQGFEHIDQDYVWKNTNYGYMDNYKFKCPSKEVDFILNIKQFVYERRYITLMDFLAVKYAYEKGLNFDEIICQVKKYGWYKSFVDLITKLNAINKLLFDEYPLVKGGQIKRMKLSKNTELPYHYPIGDVMNIFKEMYKNQKIFPMFDFAYYFFTTGRYHLTGKKRLPFYFHWFPFENIGINAKHEQCPYENIIKNEK